MSVENLGNGYGNVGQVLRELTISLMSRFCGTSMNRSEGTGPVEASVSLREDWSILGCFSGAVLECSKPLDLTRC